MRWMAMGIVAVLLGCGSGGPGGICADDGDARGPACLCEVATQADFERVSQAGGAFPAPERGAKYMAPVPGDPALLPALWQNVNRYEVHLFFLKAVFPERFSDLDEQKYLELVMLRATRKYYSGNFFSFAPPDQDFFYGFTVYTSSRSEELLEAAEVKSIYESLQANFAAGELRYTFDPYDAMAKEKARAWTDPGFPIYFPD